MTDVQVTIGLGRKAGDHAPAVPSRPEVVLDDFPDEVSATYARVDVSCHADAL
jgi:hypothetical protein